MIRVPIHLRRVADESYDVRIGRGLAPRLTVALRKRPLGQRYIIVTDSHLHRQGESLLAAFRRRGLSADLVSFPAGEGSKSRRVRDEIEDGIIRLGAGRDTALVALGGGVVGDLVGFVAATFKRGVPCVQIPTTLLGMVDSAIGGKTGINHPAGKNLIGAFHQPAAVYIDVDYLKTLPARQYTSGLAEVIKYGVIADRGLFASLESHLDRILKREPDVMARVIEACCRIKARVVSTDPRESNRRKILNFGHTIGHAVETLSGFRLAHGEAVSIGMVAEARLAARARILAPAAARRIQTLCERAGLPTAIPPAFSPAALLEVARHDKKNRQGRIAYALPGRIGSMTSVRGDYAVQVDDALVMEILTDLRRVRSRPRPLIAAEA
ncbi:MAG TPA: 3-dehydroquinate synthase [Candidatus Polarisedimenticolia bacterium]|nr:3-dehydroquinate synthase [Candidatus Polarisedimenticolia bacterium]